MGIAAVKQALQSSDVFTSLGDGEIDHLATLFDCLELKQGKRLKAQNSERDDNLFILLSGSLGFTLKTEQQDKTLDIISTGQLVGDANMYVGHGHETYLQAAEPVQLASISWSALESLFDRQPEAGERFETAMWHQAYRAQYAVHIHKLFGLADPGAFEQLLNLTDWCHLKHRDVLFREGDPGDAIYIVLTGRLQVTTAGAENKTRIINEIQSGETAGEMAVLSESPRSATVSASRDTMLARISKANFDTLVNHYPQAMFQIARMISDRLRHSIAFSRESGSATIFVVLPLHSNFAINKFTEHLSRLMEPFGSTICYNAEQMEYSIGKAGLAQVAADKHRGSQLSHWFYEQEISHRYVIYIAEPNWSNWTQRVVSQADHLLLVADAEASPAVTEVEKKLSGFQRTSSTTRRSLLLVRNETQKINGTSRWLEPRQLTDHYHVRYGKVADFGRLARILTGNAVTLVLGGGGARGYAHIGVIKALEENGIPIDMIGGTSIGSIIAAAYAMGNNSPAMLAACNQHFRRLFDFTFPMLALISGKRIVTNLHRFFAGKHIEDLYLPYFCVSSNLTRAKPVIHRLGEVESATRASMSIPGFVPPVSRSGDLLVDGGLLNNLPVDVMRSFCGRGKIIAIDISPKVDMESIREMPAYMSGWKILLSRLNPFSTTRQFNIIAVLMRSMTLSAVNSSMRLQEQAPADLYLLLPVEGISTLDYYDIESISKLGYASSVSMIQEWWSANRQNIVRQQAVADTL